MNILCLHRASAPPDDQDRSYLLSTEHADRDNGIPLWNAQIGALEKEWHEPHASLFTVSFTPDRTLVVAGRSTAVTTGVLRLRVVHQQNN
jgi:hypothetical protein